MELAYDLLDSLPYALVLYHPTTDEQGHLCDFSTRYYNQSVKVITTFSDEQMQTQTLFRRHPPSRQYLNQFESLLQTQSGFSLEHFAPHLDKWYVASFQYFQGGMLCRYEDITEQKRQWLRARNLDEQLTRQAHLNQRILDATQSGLILFEAIRNEGQQVTDFRCVLVNESMQQLVAQPIDLLRDSTLFSHFTNSESAPLFERLVAVLATGVEQRYQQQAVVRGESRWLDVILSHQGDGVLYSCLDITDLVRSKEEIQVALAAEKELSILKGRFVSMASHEFRTPLTTVLTSAQLIERYKAEGQQAKRAKHIQRIRLAVRQLTRILDEFLSIDKLNEGKINVQPVLCVVPELISEVLLDTEPDLKPKQVIQTDLGCRGPIYLDSSLLRKILLNLISNAIKYSGPGTTITLQAFCEANQLSLTVQDEGIGIAAEDQVHLFERFFRASNVSNIQGTGLGLHIVGQYVALMDGQLELESELNQGTRIRVILPYALG